MAYETTTVPVWQTQGEIRKLLEKNGGTGVAFISHPPTEGFESMMPIDGVTYRIRIRADVHTDSRDPERDMKRIWRVFFYHLKSVFEASNSGVMEFRQMMMPYIVVKDGRTIGDHILPQLDKAVDGRPERMLGDGGDAI